MDDSFLIDHAKSGQSPILSVSPYDACPNGCDGFAVKNALMTILPDSAGYGSFGPAIYGIAAHEYAHFFQAWAAASSMLPSWLWEGGAVQFQCLMAKTLSDLVGESVEVGDYQNCMRYSGGRSGGVIPNAIQYHQKGDTLKATEDAQCSGPDGGGVRQPTSIGSSLARLACCLASHSSCSPRECPPLPIRSPRISSTTWALSQLPLW